MSRTMTVAEYLSRAIELSGKTQKEIAQEVGYERPNVLSMMKQGMTKIPLNKIPAISQACGVDPGPFIRVAMIEYMPETWEVLSDQFGDVMSADEKLLVETYRETMEGISDENRIPSKTALEEAMKSLFVTA